MSGPACLPVAFLGDDGSRKSIIVGQLSAGRSRPFFNRQTSSSSQKKGVHEKNAAVQIHNVSVALKKPFGKVAVPLWDFNPDPAHAAVRHLLLSQACSACYVWLDARTSEDEMIASAASWILDFRRCLTVPGEARLPVYLAAVKMPGDSSPCQASPDWPRVAAGVRKRLEDDDKKGYKRFLRLCQDVIEVDSGHLDPVLTRIRDVAAAELKLLHTKGLLEKLQLMTAKLDAIRKSCSLFIVPLEEFQACAKDLLRIHDDELLRSVTKANGQVVLVERDGWLPHVIVNVPSAVAVFSRLLTDDDLRQRHSQLDCLSFLDVSRAFPDLSADQLRLFLTVLQDLSLAYRTGVCGGGVGEDRDWCLPLLNCVRRGGVKWLLSRKELRTAVVLPIPAPELFARIQVVVSGEFGVNNIKHWQASSKLTCTPQVLMCMSAPGDIIAWEVASHDAVAEDVHRCIKALVLAQCRLHMPCVEAQPDDAVSNDFFKHLMRQSDDGEEDCVLESLSREISHFQPIRTERPVEEDEVGHAAGGDIQKHSPTEQGVTAPPLELPSVVPLSSNGSHPDNTLHSRGCFPPPTRAAHSVAAAVVVPAVPAARNGGAAATTAPPPPLFAVSSRSRTSAAAASRSAVSSDGSLTDESSDAANRNLGRRSPGDFDSGSDDDDSDDEPPLDECVTFSPGLLLIKDMSMQQRRMLADACDVHAERGWRGLLREAELSNDVEQEIENCTGSSRTVRILERAGELGLSMSLLSGAMAKLENVSAVKTIAATREEMIAAQLHPEDIGLVGVPSYPEPSSQAAEQPPLHHVLPAYAGSVSQEDIDHPPPAYVPRLQDAKPAYARQVPAGAKVVLISYFWESDEFAAEVARWCELLRRKDIDVRLDQFERDVISQDPGGLLGWKEAQYSLAEMVIIFGSTGYARSAMQPHTGGATQPPDQPANYPCGCGVKVEYTRLLAPRFTSRLLSAVPVLLPNLVPQPRIHCLPILLQSPGSYKLPANEHGLICRLTDRNPIPRPVVQRHRPEFYPRANPYSRSRLASNGFHGQDGAPPPVNQNHPFRFQSQGTRFASRTQQRARQ